MKLVISPAKSLDFETKLPTTKATEAQFLDQSKRLNTLLKKMASYSWPGNVRELQHAIEKAVILSDGKRIEDRGIIADRAKTGPESEEPITLEDMEKIMIERSVQKNKGNLSKVAGELGITRATLYRKMEKFGI